MGKKRRIRTTVFVPLGAQPIKNPDNNKQIAGFFKVNILQKNIYL